MRTFTEVAVAPFVIVEDPWKQRWRAVTLYSVSFCEIHSERTVTLPGDDKVTLNYRFFRRAERQRPMARTLFVV